MAELLDCTLRDGGYYTNWDFQDDLVADYLHAMSGLPISMIELGYRSKPKAPYMGRYFYLDRSDLARAKGALRPDQRLAIMLNAKDCEPEDIPTLLEGCGEWVDIVRFACDPGKLSEGLELARATKDLGFQVAMNVMYLTKYIDDLSPIAPLAKAGNAVDFVALVDSYGGCMPEDVTRAFASAVETLPQKVGFHGHNNISLAFANSIAAIEAGAAFVDGTIMGMGRGAGNVPTEIMLAYYGAKDKADVNYALLATLVDRFEPLHQKHGWGPSLPYMVSGFANLPQADVMSWLSKRRYTPGSIVDALRSRHSEAADTRVLPAISDLRSADRDVALIVGGGDSVIDHLPALSRFVERERPHVIHASLRNANLLPEDGRFVCLAGQELARWTPDTVSKRLGPTDRVVTQPPPRFAGSLPQGVDAYQTDVSEDFEGHQLGPISDVAPIQLSLAAARDLGCKTIYLAGFDGYANADIEQQALMADFMTTLRGFCDAHPDVNVVSMLPTQYDLPVRSLHAAVMT